MDNSIYIVLSRQLAQFEDISVTANNIANAKHPRLQRAEAAIFSQYLG